MYAGLDRMMIVLPLYEAWPDSLLTESIDTAMCTHRVGVDMYRTRTGGHLYIL